MADKRKRRRVPPPLNIVTTLGAATKRMESTDHLRCIVVFLLNMKVKLTSLGITHRDLRLPIILRNHNTNRLGLIDLDDSVKRLHNMLNADVAHLDIASHAPEMFMEGGTHDHTVDLRSIGFLIQHNLAHGDQTLRLLMNDVMKPANQLPEVTVAMIACWKQVYDLSTPGKQQSQ